MALKFWGKFVAGPVIAAAGVAQLFVHVAWLAWLTLGASVCFVFVAQYQAWSFERTSLESEREKRENEREKSEEARIRHEAQREQDRRKHEEEREQDRVRFQRELARREAPAPWIDGEVSNFRPSGFRGTSGPRSINGVFSCDAYLCNHSPQRTNFQGIAFDGSAVKPPIRFSDDPLGSLGVTLRRNPQLNETGQLLENGIGLSVTDVTFAATIEGLSEFREIDLKGLVAYAIDGFGARHPLRIREGETLSWD
jgi:hypothetical protein